MAKAKQELTVDLLLRRGYFPVELAPPFRTDAFADFATKPIQTAEPKFSKNIHFSIPKSWPARRVLSVPNPLHQFHLSNAVAKHWPDLREILNTSKISLSTPTIFPGGTRAVSRRADFDVWGAERFQRSAGLRFVLKTDISRFYHTIYTHSLPWAIHGKEAAKANRTAALFGNILDTCVRNTQDQQTMGLPVGPDTSFILAEIIGARIDQDLTAEIGQFKGVRYVDDFHLYFETRAEAESAYAALTRIAKKYELELNDKKTELFEGPDTGEPNWKTALKGQAIRGTGGSQRASLVSFVSKAFELAKHHPIEGVMAYAVKKAAAAEVDDSNSDVYEAFLRAAIVHDATTMPLVTRLLFDRRKADKIAHHNELQESLTRLIIFHSQLRHQYEVCWLLWLCGVLQTEIPTPAIDAISTMDAPFVALLTLDLRERGLVSSALDTSRWEALMLSESLYDEYWILAYEAAYREWLPTASGNYLNDDPFFSTLAKNNVSFYDVPEDSGVEYITFSTGGY